MQIAMLRATLWERTQNVLLVFAIRRFFYEARNNFIDLSIEITYGKYLTIKLWSMQAATLRMWNDKMKCRTC